MNAQTVVASRTVVAEPARRPSWRRYFRSLLYIIGGGVLSAVLLATLLGTAVPGMQRFEGPGETTVRLENAGTYTIFHEFGGEASEGASAPPSLDGARLVVTAAESGAAPTVDTGGGGDVTYGLNGLQGVAVATVEIPAPGVYRFEATLTDGRETALRFAVSDSMTNTITLSAIASIAVMIGGFIAALVSFARTWRARSVRASA